MPRVVSLFLPTRPTDKLVRKLLDAAPPANAALILTSRTGGRRLVFAANATAHKAGLRVGVPASKPQALVPDLIIRDAEPSGDAGELETLALRVASLFADCCWRFP